MTKKIIQILISFLTWIALVFLIIPHTISDPGKFASLAEGLGGFGIGLGLAITTFAFWAWLFRWTR